MDDDNSYRSDAGAEDSNRSGNSWADSFRRLHPLADDKVKINVDSIFSDTLWLKIVWLVLVYGLALLLLFYLLLYPNELRFQGIFLKYSTRFLNERPLHFLHILFFLVLNTGLVALFHLQHIAFSRQNHRNNNFFNFSNPGVLGILNIIELIWGLQFLKDACKYVVIKFCS